APLPLDKVVLDPALSPSEVNDYTNLKQHLYNFLNNFATSQKAKEGEKTTEVAANEAEVTPSSVGDYKTITNEDYQNLDNYLEPPPGTAPAPDTAPPIPAPDTAAATPLAPEIPVAPVTPPPGEVASAPTVPNSPSPPPAPAATDPIPAPVAQIPASPTATPDIKPVELTNKTPATTDPEKKPAAPANKISEEDLSYMQAMDKKRQDLPKNKQLPEDAIDTIKTVTPGLVTDKTKNLAASDPEKINIKRGKETAAPVEGDDGIITGSGNTAMSARPKEMAKVDRVINKKLEKAYRALLLGQLSASVAIYKEVLDKDPNNKDALFGLGTAYHKNSQFDQARNIYTKILEKEPNNKEVLNNFLVLVAEEAPNDALIELQKLERINSDFSPIPAQIAMIYLKLNNPQKAERYLRRAVILSPENITYKYNLAITSDRLNNHRQAIRLYRQIIEAVAHGAVIPGSITSIEDRLSFLEEKVKDE
ncbi:MAG: hypothetical protein K0R98_1378, partial [Rickettsiaceae bacterium]|nr:hypothetical protein [Rickettsiaceae bacterium]